MSKNPTNLLQKNRSKEVELSPPFEIVTGISNTLNEDILDFLKRPADKTKIESDGKTINIQKIVGNRIMNIEYKDYSNGQQITKSSFDNPDLKKDLKKTVMQLSKDGTRNKDIAKLLDISPSYVSKLKTEK